MNMIGEDEKYIYKNNKKLKYGYTTGSCAAAAAKAATIMLLRNTLVNKVELMTPKGMLLSLRVLDVEIGEDFVKCAIKKDSGDDPDVTHGILVYAKVSRSDLGKIIIDGGLGVGRVTRKGLEQPIGSAAINKVPRSMIYNAVNEICEDNDYSSGIDVEISIPEGEKIAEKTFNPRLGIIGGISILGTTGIVEPMSEAALIDTIRVEVKQLAANGVEYLVVTPGNYGENFLHNNMSINISESVKCSNFIGDTIDIANEFNLKGLLLIGHIGKLVKLAGGIMNTHSKNADGRMEIITANAALAGGEVKDLKNIMGCITTDEALDVLDEGKIKNETMNLVMEKIDYYMNKRADRKLLIGAIMFSNEHGLLGETKDVENILEKLNEGE